MKTCRFVFLFIIMGIMALISHAADVKTIVNAQVSVYGQNLSPRYESVVYRNLKVVAYVDGKECGRQEECTVFYTPQQTRIIYFPISVVTSEANIGKTIEMHLIVTAPDDGSSDNRIWYDSEFAKTCDGEYIIQDVVLPSGVSGLTVKNGAYGSVEDESMSFVTLDFVPSYPSFPEKISINVDEEKDLLPLIYYSPDNGDASFNDKVSIPFNPTIEWDFGNSAEYINVEKNVLKGIAETDMWEAYLGGRYINFPSFSIWTSVKVIDPTVCKVYASLFVDGEELESYDEYSQYGLSAYVKGQRVAGPVACQAISPAGGPGFLLKLKNAPKGNIEFRVSKRTPAQVEGVNEDTYSASEYIIQSAKLIEETIVTTFPFKEGTSYGSIDNTVKVELVIPTQVEVSPTEITAEVGQSISFANTFTVSFFSSDGSPASIPSSYETTWNVGNYVDFFSTEGDLLTVNKYVEKALYVGARIQNEDLNLNAEAYRIKINVIYPLKSISFEKPEQIVWAGETVDVSYLVTPADAASYYEIRLEYDQSVFARGTIANILKVSEKAEVGTYTIKALAYDRDGKALGVEAELKVEVRRHVESFSLTASSLTMDKGSTRQLDNLVKEVLPSDASDKRIGWKLSGSGTGLTVKEIDGKWYVTANAVGQYTLTAYSVENPQLTQRLSVTVNAVVGGITVNSPVQSVYPGGSIDLGYKVDSSDEVSVEWTSSDAGVVSVTQGKDGKWVAAAVKPGIATLTVKTVPGSKTATIAVTVWSHVSGLTLTEETLTLNKGMTTVVDRYVRFIPEDAHDKSLRWTSSNESVASLMEKNGYWSVSALSRGEAMLTVTSIDNPQATAIMLVEVVVPLEGVAAVYPNQTVKLGSTVDLSCTFTPADASDLSMTWTSSDDAVVAVSIAEDGNPSAIAKGFGSATLTGKTNDGGFTTTIIVTVPCHVTEIKLTTSSISLKPSQTFNPDDYVQAVLPEQSADKSLTWKSSDADVVKLKGKSGAYTATAVGVGEAILTVRSNDNPDVSATLKVTVTENVIVLEGLAFTNPTQTVFDGEAVNISLTSTPADANSYSVQLKYDEKIFEYKSSVLKVRPGVAAGKYTIVAQAYDADNKEMKISATLTVTVRTHVSGVAISDKLGGEPLSVTKGESVTLNEYVVVTPADAYNKNVEWTSSNTSVATVSEKDDVWFVTGVAVGEATLIVKSKDNPDISAYLEVQVVEGITGFSFVKTVNMTKEGETKTIEIIPIPKTAFVDVNKFLITVDDIYGQGKDWKYLDVAVKEQGGRIEAVISAAYTWGINTLNVFYEGKNMGSVTVNVGAVMPFEKGWNWISTPCADYKSSKLDEIDLDDMGAVFGKDLQEIRATDVLLYKDPVMGYFGDFAGLSSTKMYQFYFEQKPETFVIYNINRNKESVNVSSGWNWLAYPYEYTYSLTELTTAEVFASVSDGDRIVVQDEFAEFADGKWVGTLATLQPSKGLMYYREAGADATIEWKGYDALGQKLSAPSVQWANGRRAETMVWNYDDHAYADNMTIVATIDAVDFPENCTVGAFVGGECRGQGKYVDGRFFITIHGVRGESISFVLYDEQTQTYRAIFGSLSFSDKAGSVQTPLRLKAGGQVTAIDDLKTVNEKLSGSRFYDLQGRPVEAPVKGMYIINGEKKNIK